MLPYSESCERNQDYILEYLSRLFAGTSRVLEIGTGTAQHAVHFARALPHLTWICSDLEQSHPGIRARLAKEGSKNIEGPLLLDVADEPWQAVVVDAVFSANSLHIMSARHVEHFMRGVDQVLEPGGQLVVYGPFKYGGEFTTPSNANFDLWLKRQDPLSGVRDFETVDELASGQGLQLITDHAMPANNQLLVWERQPTVS